MKSTVSRRSFLLASAALPVFLTKEGRGKVISEYANTDRGKAVVTGAPTHQTLLALKEAGFDGIETNAADVSPKKAAQYRKIADELGMRIHSVLRGWMQFNSSKKAKVEESVESVKTALRAANAYGANAVLVVPCRIGGMKIPQPWEFDIEFDPKTGHLKRVTRGDDSPYEDYIQAHNHSTDASREALKRLIPVAEETGVVIAIENVWNNLWVKPDIFSNFVASFNSKWVQAYFDIGNHVKYAPSEDFVRALGPMIAKCHVKDFKLNPDGHGGKFVDLRDGSVDFPTVMQALDEVGYYGWMTIEGSGGLSNEEKSNRLNKILAGK